MFDDAGILAEDGAVPRPGPRHHRHRSRIDAVRQAARARRPHRLRDRGRRRGSASPAPRRVVDADVRSTDLITADLAQRGIVARRHDRRAALRRRRRRLQRRGGRRSRQRSSTSATCRGAASFTARFLIAGHRRAGRRRPARIELMVEAPHLVAHAAGRHRPHRRATSRCGSCRSPPPRPAARRASTSSSARRCQRQSRAGMMLQRQRRRPTRSWSRATTSSPSTSGPAR